MSGIATSTLNSESAISWTMITGQLAAAMSAPRFSAYFRVSRKKFMLTGIRDPCSRSLGWHNGVGAGRYGDPPVIAASRSGRLLRLAAAAIGAALLVAAIGWVLQSAFLGVSRVGRPCARRTGCSGDRSTRWRSSCKRATGRSRGSGARGPRGRRGRGRGRTPLRGGARGNRGERRDERCGADRVRAGRHAAAPGRGVRRNWPPRGWRAPNPISSPPLRWARGSSTSVRSARARAARARSPPSAQWFRRSGCTAGGSLRLRAASADSVDLPTRLAVVTIRPATGADAVAARRRHVPGRIARRRTTHHGQCLRGRSARHARPLAPRHVVALAADVRRRACSAGRPAARLAQPDLAHARLRAGDAVRRGRGGRRASDRAHGLTRRLVGHPRCFRPPSTPAPCSGRCSRHRSTSC